MAHCRSRFGQIPARNLGPIVYVCHCISGAQKKLFLLRPMPKWRRSLGRHLAVEPGWRSTSGHIGRRAIGSSLVSAIDWVRPLEVRLNSSAHQAASSDGQEMQI